MLTIDVHGSSLATSTWLSRYYMAEQIPALDVIAVLDAAKIKYVLVGAHGIGGWLQKPRATSDVDVLVAARAVKKAVRELLQTFPHLKEEEHEVVVRLRDTKTNKVLIDVIKPIEPLMKAALKQTCEAQGEGRTYRVPTLEMALALKFASMISLSRSEEDKYQDAHDFITMIKANADISEKKLTEFGELVDTGGGAELVAKVGQVRRGEKLLL